MVSDKEIEKLRDWKETWTYHMANSAEMHKQDLSTARAEALEEAKQLAIDQTCDHPEFTGDWNDACEHIAKSLDAFKDKP